MADWSPCRRAEAWNGRNRWADLLWESLPRMMRLFPRGPTARSLATAARNLDLACGSSRPVRVLVPLLRSVMAPYTSGRSIRDCISSHLTADNRGGAASRGKPKKPSPAPRPTSGQCAALNLSRGCVIAAAAFSSERYSADNPTDLDLRCREVMPAPQHRGADAAPARRPAPTACWRHLIHAADVVATEFYPSTAGQGASHLAIVLQLRAPATLLPSRYPPRAVAESEGRCRSMSSRSSNSWAWRKPQKLATATVSKQVRSSRCRQGRPQRRRTAGR